MAIDPATGLEVPDVPYEAPAPSPTAPPPHPQCPQGWKWNASLNACVPAYYADPGDTNPFSGQLQGDIPTTQQWHPPPGYQTGQPAFIQGSPPDGGPGGGRSTTYVGMPGFDLTKILNPEHKTPKYQFARAIQDLGVLGSPTAESLQRVLERLNAGGFGGSVAGDELRFGNDIVDVLQNYGSPNAAWQWIAPDTGGGGQPSAPTSTPTDYLNQARASGISQQAIDQFLQNNPGDYGRIQSALGTGSAGGRLASYPWSSTIGGLNAGALPGSDFSDPATNFLSNLINAQLGQLLTPLKNPAMDQYAQMLQGLIDTLNRPAPVNEDLKSYLDYARQTFGHLQEEPFSGHDVAIINQQQIGPIEQDRAAAKQQLLTQLGARGITPDSGIFQSALADLDRQYDQMRAQAFTGTSLAAIQQRYANQNQALNLGQSLEALNQAQQDLELQRRTQAITAAGGLTNVTGQLYTQEQQRQQQALSLASILAQLPVQRLQEAAAIAQGGQAPNALTDSILRLLGIQNEQNRYTQALNLSQQQNLYAALGNILGSVLG